MEVKKVKGSLKLKFKKNLRILNESLCPLFFIISPNDSPSKTVKNALYLIMKGLFVVELFKLL